MSLWAGQSPRLAKQQSAKILIQKHNGRSRKNNIHYVLRSKIALFILSSYLMLDTVTIIFHLLIPVACNMLHKKHSAFS
ncbi:hypothetical protein C2I06_04150 [Niallia circulans]|nr:hypothetical protein C2I06_04150 [Niallia circulans]